MGLVFYYLILPFLAAWLVIRWLKKHAAHDIPADIQRLYTERPLDKKWHRALRRDQQGLRLLGDFETRPEAVEAAYQGRKDAASSGEKSAFLVLNAKGEVLEQVDS